MLCTKCGAENNEEDVFCVSCGAVLTGVSLDDPEPEDFDFAEPAYQPDDVRESYPAQDYEETPEEQQVPYEQLDHEQPEQPAYEQPAYEQPAPAAPRPAREPQPSRAPQPRQRRRRRRNPQGLELAPIGAAALAFICLLLPWFKVSSPLNADSAGLTPLFGACFSCLGDLGKLNFWHFMALAMYLVLIASPVLVALFAWRRENNYMGISALAVLSSFLAWLFTSLAGKSGLSGQLRKLVKVSPSVGFYLYILGICAAVAVGVMLSVQRQKSRRRRAVR